jgi:lipoprotein NlpI
MKSLTAIVLFCCAAQNVADVLKDAQAALQAGKTAEAIALGRRAVALDPRNPTARQFLASAFEAAEQYKDAIAVLTTLVEADPKDAASVQHRGLLHFKAGQVEASIRDFDRYIELRPDRKVSHWQRGISYYYAGKYDEGRRQFEGYQDFDSNDVENAVWRFMCMARQGGIEKARKVILKIGDDRRVPMRQVYDLYKGDLKPDDVLAAARADNPSKDQLNSRLFYAHLYVGIWYDLVGDRKQALEHLNRAVEHRIGHYMWDVARIHRDLLKKPATP